VEKAEGQPAFFYDEVARDMAELGYFEVEDFANYRPEVKEAIGVEYGGWTIYEASSRLCGSADLEADVNRKRAL
jgi:gamma-glutamyltranspeptidase/glutathione hydrolase